MATIKDVAKKAGVSSATVSRVLADKPYVSKSVKQKVMDAVDALNYRPNRVASSLRKQSSQIIGIVVSDIRNTFFTEIARAIEDTANTHEMSVFFCNTDEDPEKERFYLNTLLDENVAGIIISPTSEKSEDFTTLLNSKLPVVTIDRRIEGANIDSVLGANVHSSRQLTQHVLDAGFKRVAAVIGLKHSTTGRERMMGYQQALEENDIPFERDLAFYVHPREAEGYDVVHKLLQLPNPPDAILTGNSRLTIGAMSAIQDLGLSVPDDVGIAGFDETNWMRHIGPGITVIKQSTHEIGQIAAELLFDRLNDSERSPREVVLKGRLLKRSSTIRLKDL